jgi:hypothetical protein
MSDAKLSALIHAQLDGEITPEQHSLLESLLRESWEARRLYLELADQHARLLQQPAISTGRLVDAPVVRRLNRWWPALAAAAATVLTAFFLRPKESPPPEATSSGCAMLSQTLDAEFTSASLRSGDTLTPGTLKLARGLAQIEFFSGATALIEGNAQIEIVSAWEARVVSGRVRVHVPPAAKGFTLHAPGMKLEDLGTEFGLNVDSTRQTSAVHVFDGEVIAHPADGRRQSLTQGMGLSRDAAGKTSDTVTPDRFLGVGELQSLVRQRQQRRMADWQAWSQQTRKDSRLIAYYTFKHWPDDRWDRLVNNFIEPRKPQRAGGAVGAQWTQGRWSGKEALEFKRPGDRVRINLDGTYSALTLACWVKVDSVDKKYNSLLLTDGYENGEPHWQIFEDGSLMFSLIYRPDGELRSGKWNQRYYSKPVFTADSLGRWHHLAVTYDNQTGLVLQYFDGKEVSREIS